ncbi:MAG: NAD(P)/FAD-dependent oxidoreductase [Betaproteobacteria bacterium]|nr:NAD(P)/FAD-dependent oxidoreductase [Betaproteobacteria bacterium]
MQQFDLVVIGSGPGGYKAALNAVHLGARVALIERDQFGGNCLNHGCIPKKTLLHMATLMERINELDGRGLVGRVQGDFLAALQRKDEVLRAMRATFMPWLTRMGVKVYLGEAAFVAPDRLRIVPMDDAGPFEIGALRTVIATGSVPRELPGCPTDGQRVFNSRQLLSARQAVQGSILCIGGGAVGVELGYMLHQFGAQVRLIEQGERLLPGNHGVSDRAAQVLERKLVRIGVQVDKNLTVQQVRGHGSRLEVVFADASTAECDHVLVAVGRTPHTRGLGLEQLGVHTDDEGFILTDACLETSVAGIYAVGDVKRSPMAAPMTAAVAMHDGKVAAINALTDNRVQANYFTVPFVIHSALEMAFVGLTEEQAEQAGFSEEVARSNLGGSGKSRACHDLEGFIEMVHDGETGQLLGGGIVAPEAGEQVHMMCAALQSHQGLWFFKEMNYSHPSWCEEMETTVDPSAQGFSRSSEIIFRPGIYAGISVHSAKVS